MRGAAILAAAASLTLALSGCTKLETTSPASVRKAAEAKDSDAKDSDAKGAAGAQARSGLGAVDCRRAKCIALTFDAGPSEHSARLLDILEEEQVPATFFLLGRRRIDTYPELVRRMADEGHELANHTWTHKILTDAEPDEIREELERPNKETERLTGRRPTLMRPPQGRTDGTVHDISRELGLSEVLWTVTAKDYKTNDSDLITKRVLEQSSRDGIILLHDLYDGTVPAVPGIIAALKRRGYVFVTVPQLLAPGKAEPGEVYR